ncbi:MAG: hypothetical protein MZV64_15805 [Ignavibacteriales bacterium]|nr:hypothetical protein [Ignavibacteriales bacterium]
MEDVAVISSPAGQPGVRWAPVPASLWLRSRPTCRLRPGAPSVPAGY